MISFNSWLGFWSYWKRLKKPQFLVMGREDKKNKRNKNWGSNVMGFVKFGKLFIVQVIILFLFYNSFWSHSTLVNPFWNFEVSWKQTHINSIGCCTWTGFCCWCFCGWFCGTPSFRGRGTWGWDSLRSGSMCSWLAWNVKMSDLKFIKVENGQFLPFFVVPISIIWHCKKSYEIISVFQN